MNAGRRHPKIFGQTVAGILVCLAAMLLLHRVGGQWWWVIVVPGVYSALGTRSGRQGLIVGTVSAGLLWLSALAYAWTSGADIVLKRVADMMGVGSPWVVAAATVLLAVASAGVACGLGYSLRVIARRPQTTPR